MTDTEVVPTTALKAWERYDNRKQPPINPFGREEYFKKRKERFERAWLKEKGLLSGYKLGKKLGIPTRTARDWVEALKLKHPHLPPRYNPPVFLQDNQHPSPPRPYEVQWADAWLD